jgi:hypothetical protein
MFDDGDMIFSFSYYALPKDEQISLPVYHRLAELVCATRARAPLSHPNNKNY